MRPIWFITLLLGYIISAINVGMAEMNILAKLGVTAMLIHGAIGMWIVNAAVQGAPRHAQ